MWLTSVHGHVVRRVAVGRPEQILLLQRPLGHRGDGLLKVVVVLLLRGPPGASSKLAQQALQVLLTLLLLLMLLLLALELLLHSQLAALAAASEHHLLQVGLQLGDALGLAGECWGKERRHPRVGLRN